MEGIMKRVQFLLPLILLSIVQVCVADDSENSGQGSVVYKLHQANGIWTMDLEPFLNGVPCHVENNINKPYSLEYGQGVQNYCKGAENWGAVRVECDRYHDAFGTFACFWCNASGQVDSSKLLLCPDTSGSSGGKLW